MLAISRRALLGSVGLGASVELVPRLALATLVRGMTLAELVGRSRHVVIGTPLGARCTSFAIGGRRMLVTETRLRVEATLALETPNESELLVRTLGGRLDGVGERIDGQAQFVRGQACAAFFERGRDGACWVTGMAQGHYPLESQGGSTMLHASQHLPTILDWEHSAVKRLDGTRLEEAERLIAEVETR